MDYQENWDRNIHHHFLKFQKILMLRNFEVKENAKLIVAAAALNTTASIQWLQNYLKDPKNREAAEYVLVQMATKNVNIVDGLLKAGLNPNSYSKYYGFARPSTTALAAAAQLNYLPGVKRLLVAGADPNLQSGSVVSPLRISHY